MRKVLWASLLLVGAATGCSGTVGSSDEESSAATSAAVSTNGLTASITKMTLSGSTYTATVTVSNPSNEPVNNWQIGINFHTGSFNGQWSGTGVTYVGGVPIFTEPYYAQTINAGSSYSFTFNGNATGSSYTPTVTTVDGVAPGVVNAGNPADGIDPISRAAATAAVNVGYQYEINKITNYNNDPNYHLYSNLIWDSHAYRLASGNQTIEFDPNAPGYGYISNQAKAELAFAQQDPTIASYLVTGLADCFGQVNSTYVYAFHMGMFYGTSFPKGGSGSITNPDGSVDAWTMTTGVFNGGMKINFTMTSNWDPNFGILGLSSISQYGASSAVNSKYYGTQSAACSPFNGPGGDTNPYLVMLVNGWQVGGRYLNPTTNCTGGCTATAQLDPVPYAEPGDYYDSNNNLVGPQPNPFGLVNTSLYADPYHAGQWSSRTVNGVQEWGTFSSPTVLYGVTKYKYVKQM